VILSLAQILDAGPPHEEQLQGPSDDGLSLRKALAKIESLVATMANARSNDQNAHGQNLRAGKYGIAQTCSDQPDEY
jgi:hypothetical protein